MKKLLVCGYRTGVVLVGGVYAKGCKRMELGFCAVCLDLRFVEKKQCVCDNEVSVSVWINKKGLWAGSHFG